MRDALSDWLWSGARRLASAEGWQRRLQRIGVPDMGAGLQRLRGLGVELHSVVDAGACVGDWTRLLLREFPRAKVLMVEAQARHQAALQALAAQHPGQVIAVQQLLGPPGRAKALFHQTEDGAAGTGSSVLAENSDVPRQAVELPMGTLDELLARERWPAPQLLKLDVQGYELQVLAGAQAALAGADFVLLEVSVWPYNEGAPLLREVVDALGDWGFRVYDCLDLSRRGDGVLLQLDLLFIREGHALLADTRTRFGGKAGLAGAGG